MDEVFLSDKKNELSFLWKDQAVVLVEHQSSISPNITLRLLLYSAFHMLADLVAPKAIYGTKLVKIPAPHFYVFYIGDDMDVDEDTLKLSASFRETKADLELVCHVFNITYKEHREIPAGPMPLSIHRKSSDAAELFLETDDFSGTSPHCVGRSFFIGGVRKYHIFSIIENTMHGLLKGQNKPLA